jgi:chaperone modulatory protein CbpM
VDVAVEKPVEQPELEYRLSLAEISRCCGVTAERILIMVSEGILTPTGTTQREWRFASSDLARARSALRLERDLGINPAGAALAIDLIDEMQQLRHRVHLLEALFLNDRHT